MIYYKKHIILISLLVGAPGILQAQEGQGQISIILGQQSKIPLRIKASSEVTKCNIEILIPGQSRFEREVSAPDFETIIDITPASEGVSVIEWKGRFKPRGFNSVLGCDGGGKMIVNTRLAAAQITAKWTDYFLKLRPEIVECVKIGMDLNRIYFESSDPDAKLTLPSDSMMRPIYEKCDFFSRTKQLQKNFSCSVYNGYQSICNNEYFERKPDGNSSIITRAEAIKLYFTGGEFSITNSETSEAKNNRLRAEEESRIRRENDLIVRQRQEEELKNRLATEAAIKKRQDEEKYKQVDKAATQKSLPSQDSKRRTDGPQSAKQELPKAELPAKQEAVKSTPQVKSTTDL